MTPKERFQRIRQIFAEACDHPAAQREAYLADVCDGDTSLRREIQALLDQDQRSTTAADAAESQAAELLAAELAAEAEADPALLPARIGDYRIIRMVGHGGMGAVYEAEQENPKRRVALKMVRPGLVHGPLLKRLQREAHVLGRLQHPGIAQVHEAGFTPAHLGGHPYFAMEFIDGLPLNEFAERRGLCAHSRMEIVARTCDAVHHAHEQGVIHRDLKHGNILVVAGQGGGPIDTVECGVSPACGPHFHCAGQPKIVDFGVARATEGGLHLATLQTHVGHLVGTINYMSPEQISGDSDKLDRRCDVYALGVILHELLAGKPPLDVRKCSIPEAAKIIRDDEPTRLGSVNTLFRGDIETIVGKALDKDPDRRYQTAADMAADIRRFLSDRPIEARRAGVWYRARKFTRRNRILVGGIAATMIALIVGLIGTTWLALRESNAHRDADRALYRAGLAVAEASLRDGDVVTARQHLLATPPAFRGWEWAHYTARLDQSSASAPFDEHVEAIPGPIQRGLAQCWFSDADSLLHAATFCVNDQRLEAGTWEAGTLERRHTWFIPDGRIFAPVSGSEFVAVQPDGECRLHEADGGAPAATTTRLPFAFTKRTSIVTSIPQMLVGRNLDDESAVPIDANSIIAFSPDGRFMCVAAKVRDVTVYSLDNTQPPIYLEPHPEGIGNAVFSADGHYLITAGNDRRLACFDLQDHGRRVWKRSDAHDDAILAAALSPDGVLLATGGQDRVLRIWDALTGAPYGRLVGHRDPILAIAFSSDGCRIASYSSNVVKTWRVEAVRDPTVMHGHEWYVYSLAVSPDGALLASYGDRLRVWDAGTGLNVYEEAPRDSVQSAKVSFSADGHDLLVSCGISGSGGAHRETRLLNTHTGTMATSLGSINPESTLTFVGGGRFILEDTPNAGCRLLDSQTHEPTTVLGEVKCVSVGPVARRLVCVADDNVQVRDAVNGSILRSWPEHRASQVFLMRNDTVVAVALLGGPIDLYDVESGARLGTLNGHASRVTCFAELPAHDRLITGSDDRTIRLWDIDRLHEVCVLRGHTDRIWDLAVTPDETAIFSASGDYTIRRWDTRPIGNLLDARQSYERAAETLAPKIKRWLIDAGQDPLLVIARVKADPSMSDRERQIARQCLWQTVSSQTRSFKHDD